MTEERTGYKTVDKWLGRMAPSTARTSMVFLRKFMRWMGENGGQFADYTPDQLVLYQKEAENSQQYDILDLVQGYVGQLDLRAKSKKREYAALRSLFAHNRATLPVDPTFRVRSQHMPVEGILKVEEIRDMILSCNKVYRAVFLCMFQGGMGLDELDHWNRNGWDKLQQDLRGDPEFIRVDLPGRKLRKNVDSYYTLLGPDAIKVLKEWVAVRPEDVEAIFTNQHGAPVHLHSARQYWLRHLEKLGFIQRERNGKKSNRYGKSPHEMRDVFRSQWEKSPAKASVAEFMMGHTVDPLHYNKACRDEDWVREEYLQALPMLQIMSSDTPFGMVNAKTVKNLQGRIAELEAQIEMMNPAFEFAQTLFKEKRDRDKLQESAKEP
ncbi:hypothetical protein ES703_45907 [subsurface metagenome]